MITVDSLDSGRNNKQEKIIELFDLNTKYL